VAESLAPGRQVEVVVNGVETDRFRPVEPTRPPASGLRQVIVPRRLFPKNGVEFALRAVPGVTARLPTSASSSWGTAPSGSGSRPSWANWAWRIG
jgi:glycosyltransferase involved in cell wall biosynthesis